MEAVLLSYLKQLDGSIESAGVPVTESCPVMIDYVAKLVDGGYLDAKILPSFPGEEGGPVIDVAVVYSTTDSGRALLDRVKA
jgi:hypothetical protein